MGLPPTERAQLAVKDVGAVQPAKLFLGSSTRQDFRNDTSERAGCEIINTA